MGYSIESFKEALQNSAAFIDVIKANGYDSINGNCQSFWFEKQISKTNDGGDESFTVSVTNQISGYVTASLDYRKKLKGSTDVMKMSQWLSSDITTLDARINECEKSCLAMGAGYKGL